MTHVSPSAFIVWSVLSTALGAFLLGHLWRFDRFKCLRWSNAPYSGAFKRIMTYTYLITIPLIMTYSFGFAFIKYKEGFIDVGGGIFPKPYTYWRPEYRSAIFPLMMVFSFAWSFEMVTHLEELCFWLFLITAGPAQPDWFRSPYFRLWAGGSLGAAIYLPVVTIVYRREPLSCEARVFTAGSVGDLVVTLAFIPILWRFPEFIRKVKAEGVDSAVIIRLHKFYELNVIRIIFRFLMQLPLLTLGVDGLTPHTHVNESLFWTDSLSTVAALGCVFSSVCTLLIFFPRSYEAEYQAKEASYQRSIHTRSSRQMNELHPTYSLHEFGENMEPSLGKSATFQTWDSDADHEDNVKNESAERRMAMVKERWGSKIREREGRMGRGAKKAGTGLHEALSRRLLRLPLTRRRHTDPEGSISLSFGVPSLSHFHDSSLLEGREATRRTAPTARSGYERNESSAGGASVARKDTYLLTDSPVLRTRKMRDEPSMESLGGSASVEMGEIGYGYGLGLGLGAEYAFGRSGEKGEEQGEYGNGDALAHKTPAPVSSFPHASPTSALIHIHDPHKKSNSLSTTATIHRALPTPPTDPLGAAPSYYPPEGRDLGQGQGVYTWTGTKNAQRLPEVDVGMVYASQNTNASVFQTTSNPNVSAPVQRPTFMRELTGEPGVLIIPEFDDADGIAAGSGDKMREGRSPMSRTLTEARARAAGLTAANVSQHNIYASRTPQINPLVHTFTSPIDFLDRREGLGGAGANGSRTQIGWVV